MRGRNPDSPKTIVASRAGVYTLLQLSLIHILILVHKVIKDPDTESLVRRILQGGVLVEGTYAVSYTHLDVYKRQHMKWLKLGVKTAGLLLQIPRSLVHPTWVITRR